MTNILPGLFYPCVNLESFVVSANNPSYSSINGVLFEKNQTVLVEYPYNGAGGYAVSSGVKSIAFGAFANCVNLANISLPCSLTNIGPEAFSYCHGLTNIIIPDGVTSIEDRDICLLHQSRHNSDFQQCNQFRILCFRILPILNQCLLQRKCSQCRSFCIFLLPA